MSKLRKLLNEKKYLIMGILNFTPDSFSDGGDFFDVNCAKEQVKKMIEDGADIIDIGAESTRPGAVVVSEKEEIKRLESIFPTLRKEFPNVCFSVDTYKENVAEYMIKQGVDILNDVNGAKNSNMAQIAAKYDIPIIVMHNGGVEETKEIEQVVKELGESVDICLNAGVKKDNIIVDPGMGFGKTAEANLTITKNLSLLSSLNCEILYAVSRKRTTDYILGGNTNPKDRDVVSAVLSIESLRRGARIVRVHNVKIMKEAVLTYEKING
ncbi:MULTISPECIES: dihydropteroate synthase [Gemella]|uniref:dihydropteroate synthase n=1 Tax=Gemella TaxID=1378 RepID=UPI0007681F3F|nr:MULTISPECIES: dihydropteroate synthase [Gemella]AME10102.1 dihydropteroate synthase [Gemella sp. oral taxon 928]AXI26238.1 dihydropteroate synthase [Gemella sp. ND 6198]